MACMMLPGCARSCGGASVFYCCWRLEHAARRPNLARMAAAGRTQAEQAEQPEVADVEEARRRGGICGRTERRWRHGWLRAQSSLVSGLRARHRRLLCRRLSRRRLSAAGWRSRRVWIGRRVRQRRRRRSRRHDRRRWARRHHRLGRCWRRVWLQRPRRHRRWIGRHGWIRAVRRARVHEQRALRATQLWRHGSAVQSASRWRPMSDRMDVSGFLQHFTDTGARLRGATVHASRSFLHHAARVVRRHGHLLVPPGKRLPDRRRVRPHQWRRSHLSVGLTKTKGTNARAHHLESLRFIRARRASGCDRHAHDHARGRLRQHEQRRR